MKTLHLSILAVFLTFAGLMSSYDNTAYGIWVRQSPQELLNDSATIFVGNITSVNVLQFEKETSSIITENGIEKSVVKNYTLSIDEYHVNIEEFLKNPMNVDKITVRQPITSWSPGMLGALDEFHVGDRVLFYVKNLDGNNTYSPESFTIPKSCAATNVLTQNRLEARGESFTIQNGIKSDSNFTANYPIHFVDNEDVDALSGKSFDIHVKITKNTGSNPEVVFNKEIHSEAKPCEWIAPSEWQFTPQEGYYRMDVVITEDNNTYAQYVEKFSVKSDVATSYHMSPLQQSKSGTNTGFITCKPGFYFVLKSYDREPLCLKAGTISKLASRGFLFATSTSNDNHATVIISPGSENQASPNTYSPNVITVVLGVNNTVRWVNQADAANTIVPNMHLIQNGKSFGSDGVIKPDQSYTFTFTEPGTFAYHTEPHPWMKGTVIVLPQSYQITGTKANDPFGITALVIYKPQIACLSPPSHSAPAHMPSCPPNNFYLKINSNSTAYLLGYNICDGKSCAKSNDLSVLLPINVISKPDYQMIGLPVDLQWKYGDTVNIQLEVSPNADNKTASPIDLGNSMIVP